MTHTQHLLLARSQFGGKFKLPALPLLSLLLLKNGLNFHCRVTREASGQEQRTLGITNFFEASVMVGSGKAIT